MAADPAPRIRIDMHLHTRRSFDSLNDPDAVLRTARERGLDVICVTDHNQIATALELKQRFPRHIIVGEEVKTAEEDLQFSLPKELRQDAAGRRDARALGGRVTA